MILFSRVVIAGVVDVFVGVDGDVDVGVGVAVDVGVAAAEAEEAEAVPPMTDFSPIMHPVPMLTGPS